LKYITTKSRNTGAVNVKLRMVMYLVTLVLAVTGTAVAVYVVTGFPHDPAVVAALCLAAALAERGRVRLSTTIQESISLLPTLFAAVLFGPLAAILVAAASMAPELRPAPGTQSPRLRWGIYTCTRALTAAAVAVVAGLAADLIRGDLASIVAATTSGALVGQALDAGFAALTLRLRRASRLQDVLRAVGPLSIAAVPLYAPLVAFLAFAYQHVSPLTLPLFFLPALAAQSLFALYQAERHLTVELINANAVLERANLSFATALVATLDARDRYTAGHSAAVAIYARDIAARLGLSEEDQKMTHVAGLVHDVGKIGLAPGLLEKPGALTLNERRQMEQHPVIGERILRNVESYSLISDAVRHHHERLDGRGYPDGIVGEEIPLLARIIAVADAYNAMTSDRPYRDAMPSRVARLRLAQGVETQFDTAVVAAFEAILAAGNEDYRLAKSAQFALTADTTDAAPTDEWWKHAEPAPHVHKA
jgi:putative nucleotidyltransferase with HDIG domain